MRKALPITIGVLVFALGSATALASRAHERGHHGHHARSHLRRFGDLRGSSTSGGGTSTANPTPNTGDSVATVASFSNGVLVLTLSNGSVSGIVTSDTRIECSSATGNGDDEMGTDAVRSEDHGGGGSDDGGDRTGDGPGAGNCSTASLVPGAAVEGAELRVSSAGSTWREIELA
jgi:hypothetical protein